MAFPRSKGHQGALGGRGDAAGGDDAAGLVDDDGGILHGVDYGAALAIEDERLAPSEDHIAHVPRLGDPDGAAEGGDLEALAVLDAVYGQRGQVDRPDVKSWLHDRSPCAR